MKTQILCICLLNSTLLYAQQLPDPNKPVTLSEQYQQMKTHSETFADYKVIKEYLLEKTWKAVNDSIKVHKAIHQQDLVEIAKRENELQTIRTQWKAKEESMGELEFKGAHISFLGIDFGKKTFLSMVIIVFASVLALLGLMVIQVKSMNIIRRERSESLNNLAHEFEEYKRKALEKQSKISRELQNERNRLVEMRKV